jgi:hypothetical protein
MYSLVAGSCCCYETFCPNCATTVDVSPAISTADYVISPVIRQHISLVAAHEQMFLMFVLACHIYIMQCVQQILGTRIHT